MGLLMNSSSDVTAGLFSGRGPSDGLPHSGTARAGVPSRRLTCDARQPSPDAGRMMTGSTRSREFLLGSAWRTMAPAPASTLYAPEARKRQLILLILPSSSRDIEVSGQEAYKPTACAIRALESTGISSFTFVVSVQYASIFYCYMPGSA